MNYDVEKNIVSSLGLLHSTLTTKQYVSKFNTRIHKTVIY